jgi:hypothetical protein
VLFAVRGVSILILGANLFSSASKAHTIDFGVPNGLSPLPEPCTLVALNKVLTNRSAYARHHK